jgi:hypothetical protein
MAAMSGMAFAAALKPNAITEAVSFILNYVEMFNWKSLELELWPEKVWLSKITIHRDVDRAADTDFIS